MGQPLRNQQVAGSNPVVGSNATPYRSSTSARPPRGRLWKTKKGLANFWPTFFLALLLAAPVLAGSYRMTFKVRGEVVRVLAAGGSEGVSSVAVFIRSGEDLERMLWCSEAALQACNDLLVGDLILARGVVLGGVNPDTGYEELAFLVRDIRRLSSTAER